MTLKALATPFAAASLLLASSASSAALLDVVITTDVLAGDFSIGTDSVFGEAPADQTYSVTLQVDTTAGPPDFAAAGSPTNGIPFAHDVWGYNVVSGTATFGSKTWDSGDILTLNFGDGITDSKLFVDAELVAGATPNLASYRMEDGDGFLFIGVRALGGVAEILETFEINDFNGAGLGADNDVVFTQNYRIEVRASAVPEPGAMALFGLALVGFVATRRRGRRPARSTGALAV